MALPCARSRVSASEEHIALNTRQNGRNHFHFPDMFRETFRFASVSRGVNRMFLSTAVFVYLLIASEAEAAANSERHACHHEWSMHFILVALWPLFAFAMTATCPEVTAFVMSKLCCLAELLDRSGVPLTFNTKCSDSAFESHRAPRPISFQLV